jgi:hypothetical protein
MAETRYTPRLDLPYAIERGRSQVITLSVYSGATLTAPSSGTLTLYAPDGTSASSGSVSIVSDVAEYTVAGLTSYGLRRRVGGGVGLDDARRRGAHLQK